VGIKLICLYVGFQTIHGLLLLLNSVMQSLNPPPLVPAPKQR